MEFFWKRDWIMKILVTGAAGFIAGYVIEKLLKLEHTVIGIDNYSKYGETKKTYDKNSNYNFYYHDAKDVSFLKNHLSECDHFIHLASKIGGIRYFSLLSYDLLAENERLIAAAMDAAIYANKFCRLKKITVISSSMVFENATIFPTKESHIDKFPSPSSTYGFQKLACEYFAKGAWEQYRLPYTIIRPFNCAGIGETKPLCEKSNNEIGLSHVIPDLCKKILMKQNPLHILGDGSQIRCYTYGGDIADGIIISLENKNAKNQTFNISANQSISVLELAKLINYKINGTRILNFVYDKAPRYDVQKRIPNVEKAKKLLKFEATTSLDKILDEVIPWIDEMIKANKI